MEGSLGDEEVQGGLQVSLRGLWSLTNGLRLSEVERGAEGNWGG